MACNCSESKTNGVPNNLGVHDCEYIQSRNALIPKAIEYADKRASRNTTDWTRLFIRKMDNLFRGTFHDEPKEPAPAPVVNQQTTLLQAMLDANRFSHTVRSPQAESIPEGVGVSDE